MAITGALFILLGMGIRSERPREEKERSVEAIVIEADGYDDITVSMLAAMMKSRSFTLVNVHIPYEGELPQTDLFIPFHKITDRKNLKKLPDKDAPIVLYCRSGSMGSLAAERLKPARLYKYHGTGWRV